MDLLTVPGNARPVDASVGSTYTLPTGFTLPAGMAVYGTASPYDEPPAYGAGPDAALCHGQFAGADGGFAQVLDDPATHDHMVASVLRAGGFGPELMLSCPYIHTARAAVAAAGFTPVDVAKLCTPAAGVRITAIATGEADTHIAAIRATPPARIPNGVDEAPVNADDPTLALFTFHRVTGGGYGQAVICTLPASQSADCLATLILFLETQTDVGRGMSSASMSSAIGAIRQALR